MVQCYALRVSAYMYIRCTNTNIRTSLDLRRTLSTTMLQNLIDRPPTASAAQDPTSVDTNDGSECAAHVRETYMIGHTVGSLRLASFPTSVTASCSNMARSQRSL